MEREKVPFGTRLFGGFFNINISPLALLIGVPVVLILGALIL